MEIIDILFSKIFSLIIFYTTLYFRKEKALLFRGSSDKQRLRKCNGDIREKLVGAHNVSCAVTWCKVWSVMRGSLREVMTIGRPDGGRDKNSPSLLAIVTI